MKKKKKPAKDYYVETLRELGAAEFDRRVYRYNVLLSLVNKRDLGHTSTLDSIFGKGAGNNILKARIGCLDSDLLVRYTARIIYLAFIGHFG